MAQEKTAPTDGERFVNRIQALNWLRAQGYKVSQGKFYQDVKAGFPALHRDGTVSRFQVMQYGQQLDIETRGAAGPGTSDEDEARKVKADADIACMKAERMAREDDKYWLHAPEAWATLAALMGTLHDSILHHIYAGQRELIHAAAGDQERSQELYEEAAVLVKAAFNEVAGGGLKVQFEREVK